jgi:non-specific serine/threonine protein kinase
MAKLSLPVSLTSFVGREKELSELSKLLFQTRLITLTGVGGCGKTRLALRLANQLGDTFQNGVGWVDFAPAREGAHVPQLVARAFLLEEIPNQSITEPLIRFLKNKQVLILLDNCEHLSQAIASLTHEILMACPDVRVIATSREPLNLNGETTWRVPALSFPIPAQVRKIKDQSTTSLLQYDAVRLFVERATSIVPQFALTESNTRIVLSICQRLEGLPLAIELAAARVNMFSVEEISTRINDRFSFLASPVRYGIDPRHQTLKNTIDWSYDLLSEAEASLLFCLSVFEGGFALDAAEAICSAGIQPASVLENLTSLVDKSMLQADTLEQNQARFHLLETIREYAREKGNLQAQAHLQEKHLEYYMLLAEKAEQGLKGSEQLSWLARLDAEQGNLRAALREAIDHQITGSGLRLAGALQRYWDARGEWKEGLGYLLNLLSQASETHKGLQEEAGQQIRVKAICAAGNLSVHGRNMPVAQDLFNQSLRLAQEIEDPAWIALSICGLSWIWIYDGTLVQKRETLEQAVEYARETGDEWLLANCLVNLVHAVGRVDYDKAMSMADESIRLARKAGDQVLLSEALFIAANVAITYLDNQRVASLAVELIDVSRVVGRKTHLALGLFLLGGARLFAEQTMECARLWIEAFKLSVELNAGSLVGLGLYGVCVLYAATGESKKATILYGTINTVLATAGIDLNAWWAPGTSSENLNKRYITPLRSQLGDEVYFRAFQQGQEMSPDQAIEAGLRAADDLWNTFQLPGQKEGQAEAELTMKALGPVEVAIKGRRLTSADWGYTKAQELLFYLLCHEKRTREQIGLDLWPDTSPAQLRSNLGAVLHHLRQALGRPEWVVFEKGQYFFNRSLAPNFEFDVDEFHAHLTMAHRQSDDIPSRITHLQAANQLVRGDYLENIQAGDWSISFREKLHQDYLDALILLGDLHYRLSHYRNALYAYYQATEQNPYLESAHRGIMLCYAELGERAQAASYFHSLERKLRKEIQSGPSQETKVTYEQILSK